MEGKQPRKERGAHGGCRGHVGVVARRAPLKATLNQQCSLAASPHAQMEQTPAAAPVPGSPRSRSDRTGPVLLLRPQDILQ